MRRLLQACASAVRRSSIGVPQTPLGQLGIEIAEPVPRYAVLPWSGLPPSPFVQVISPGRSGTRWLADVVLASTRHAVIHAQIGSLAEIGFLLDQGRLPAESAFGAYLHARARALEFCRASGRGLVDLDCKASPLVPVLMGHFPGMRCVVALREPLAFVRSGLARGYFGSVDPQLSGHLVDSSGISPGRTAPRLQEHSRALMIAGFWNRVAVLAQSLWEENSRQVLLADMKSLFGSREKAAAVLDSLGLTVDGQRLADYRGFDRIKNANPEPTHHSRDLDEIASEIYGIACRGLCSGFLSGCGLTDRPPT